MTGEAFLGTTTKIHGNHLEDRVMPQTSLGSNCRFSKTTTLRSKSKLPKTHDVLSSQPWQCNFCYFSRYGSTRGRVFHCHIFNNYLQCCLPSYIAVLPRYPSHPQCLRAVLNSAGEAGDVINAAAAAVVRRRS